MLLKWSLGAGLGGVVCALAIAVVNAGAPAPISASRHDHAPMIIHERHGQKVNSTNWSGYAVEGANGSVTDVKGSWTVPSVIAPRRATRIHRSGSGSTALIPIPSSRSERIPTARTERQFITSGTSFIPIRPTRSTVL